MLDAGLPPRIAEGVTLFPDHRDRSLYYAMSDPPHVAVGADGAPRLSLLLFRASPDRPGGGLIQMETSLALSDAKVRAIEAELTRQGVPSPRIAQPDWVSGNARLIGWIAGDAVGPEAPPIVRSLADVEPSLLADGRAVFAARTDEQGAALLRASLLGGAGVPTGVVYDLETLGLAGPLGIDVEVDLRAAYDRLKAAASLTAPYTRATFSREVEGMVQDGSVRVRVVDQSGSSDEARTEALRRAGDEMMRRLFSPSITPATFSGSPGPASTIQLALSLRMERDTLEETATYSYRERRSVRVRHMPQATLAGALSGADATPLVREIDASSPFFTATTVTVQSLWPLAQQGASALAAHLEWGPSPSDPDDAKTTATRDVVLTDAALAADVTVPGDLTLAYRYRVEASFVDAGDGAQRTSAWRSGDGAALALSVDRLFPVWRRTFVAGAIDFDWIERVDLEVRREPDAVPSPTDADATPIARFASLDGAAASVTVRFHTDAPGRIVVRPTWRGKPGEPSFTPAAPIVADDEVTVVDPPFASSLRITVVPVFSDDLMSIVTRVVRDETAETAEPGASFHDEKTVTQSAPDWPIATIALRRIATTTAYRYAVTRLYTDGRIEQRELVDGDGTAIAAGETGFAVTWLDLVLLKGAPSATGDLAVEAIVQPVDGGGADVGRPARHLFEGANADANVPVLVPPGAPLAYRLVVRRHDARGGVHEQTTKGTSSVVVVDA